VIAKSVATFESHVSELEAQLTCLRRLVNRDVVAFVLVQGEELPALSSKKFAQTVAGHMMKNMNVSLVTSSPLSLEEEREVLNHSFHLERYGPEEYTLRLALRPIEKPQLPDVHLKLFTGHSSGALSTQHANFAVKDPMAINLLNWLQDAPNASNLFFSTLARVVINDKVPKFPCFPLTIE